MKELEVGDLIRDKFGDIGTVVGTSETEVDIYNFDLDEGYCMGRDEVEYIGKNEDFLAGKYDDWECRP